MHEAAQTWLARFPWPEGPGMHAMTQAELRGLMERGYLQGYSDCRNHKK